MDKSRFSLLLLEPNEIYFEDFSADLLYEENNSYNHKGRLKLCSKSLVFEPDEVKHPLLKILFKNTSEILNECERLSVQCKSYVEMLEGNVIASYKFCDKKRKLLFKLHYMQVEDCVSQMLQLQRASTLHPPEHNCMIAAIAYSRQSRLKFDPNWLEDIYEAVIIEMEASKVSPLVTNPGRVVLSSTTLYFQPFNNAESYPVLRIALRHVKEVTRRRFLQRQVGLEVECPEAPVPYLYLSFKCEEDREILYNTLLQQPSLQLLKSRPEMMTLKWQNGAISNYDYLIYLNSVADRSFNDLTQYPVFPWVVADYSSCTLNLDNPKTFRDLSKPVGALNAERLERLKQRREEMGTHRFLYGSHYSAPGFVLFYLIRKFPQYMLCLQNGRFDHPDRIFHCMADVWRNVQGNMSDFKELIPEFYNTTGGGDFLQNTNGLDLGTRHDGCRLRDVVLPPWCDGAADFVTKLRGALESDYVSRHLPKWIDLIFGWQQKGEAAEKVDNVFYHLCYEGAVDLKSVEDLNERHALEVQIMEFGQVPKQIFFVPHPPRLAFSPEHPISCSERLADVGNCMARRVAQHKDTVTGVGICGDIVVSVGRDSVLKEFRCSSGNLVRSVQLQTAGISACLILPTALTVILGTFDNRIMVYDLEYGTVRDEVRAHEDAVSCLRWSENEGCLVSGSWDGSVRVWPFTGSPSAWGRLKNTSTVRLDREGTVTCIDLDESSDLIACGTGDGEVTVFRLLSPKPLQLHLRTHSSAVTAVSISGTRLISCNSNGFQVHDIPSGLLIYSASQGLSITCLTWLGPQLLLGTQCGTIQCWDFQNVKLQESVTCCGSPVSCLAASKCGRYVLSGEGKDIVLRS